MVKIDINKFREQKIELMEILRRKCENQYKIMVKMDINKPRALLELT